MINRYINVPEIGRIVSNSPTLDCISPNVGIGVVKTIGFSVPLEFVVKVVTSPW